MRLSRLRLFPPHTPTRDARFRLAPCGGERWTHQIKFGGYRVKVHPANEAIKVFTRRGNDWARRFRKVADDAWADVNRLEVLYFMGRAIVGRVA